MKLVIAEYEHRVRLHLHSEAAADFSHHSRLNVTCECHKEVINDDGDGLPTGNVICFPATRITTNYGDTRNSQVRVY